jgi:hypothetical protein
MWRNLPKALSQQILTALAGKSQKERLLEILEISSLCIQNFFH